MDSEYESKKGYQAILEEIEKNPDYVNDHGLDLKNNIFYDAQFSSSLYIRRYAIELLGLIGSSVSQDEIERLLLALESTDEVIHYDLIIALIRLSTKNCSERALELIKTSSWFDDWCLSGDSNARNIFKAIAASKSEDFLEFLHESIKLTTADTGVFWELCVEVLSAINAVGSDKSEDIVLSLLETCEDSYLANELILTLGFVGGSKSITDLRKIIDDHDRKWKPLSFPDPHPVACASCSLGRLGDAESIEKIVELWHHGYKSLYIAKAFSLLGYKKAVPILIDSTGERKSSIVIGSLRALGEIGGDEAKRHLLYLKQKGIVWHMIDKNPEEGWTEDVWFGNKLRASLTLALHQIGENIERNRLEEAREFAKNMWEYKN
jgi:hypothetical protein